jgi:hypothetical protein
MIRPTTLVNITRIIQRTALSIPRALASRATQTKRAMLSAKKAIGMNRKLEQTAQPPAAASGFGSRWANAFSVNAPKRSERNKET